MSIPQLFSAMPAHYKAGRIERAHTYYFSIGEHRYTVVVDPTTCRVDEGKTVENADCVLKTTPELFEKMVFQGKMPGPFDIARGKVKTNDIAGLNRLRDLFDFNALSAGASRS